MSKNRTRSKAIDLHAIVKSMAAVGDSEDAIALRMGLNKNVLRARYIADLDQGREIYRVEAEREKLSAREEEMRRDMFAGFGTEWENEDGTNDLQNGRTLAEAKQEFAAWLGHHRRTEK